MTHIFNTITIKIWKESWKSVRTFTRRHLEFYLPDGINEETMFKLKGST